VSLSRQQGFIDAPVDVVWELLVDADRHPEWWPRVVEVECEGLEAGCSYRQVIQTPMGPDEMSMFVDRFDECRNLSIRCVNTGTFVRMELAEARDGTFLEAEMGMEPDRLRQRVFDVVAGRRFFKAWLRETVDALGRAARSRAG
jgi:Polyketide cyclase / dehydrase and lipid transport